MCLVSDSSHTHKQKIQAFRAHTALNTYYYLLPEPDVLKKRKQNHLLSTAIKAKFTFCFNKVFYFALPHIYLFNKLQPFGSNGSVQVGISA